MPYILSGHILNALGILFVLLRKCFFCANGRRDSTEGPIFQKIPNCFQQTGSQMNAYHYSLYREFFVLTFFFCQYMLDSNRWVPNESL